MSPKLINLLLIVGSFALYYVIISPLYSGELRVINLGQGVSSLRSTYINSTRTLDQVKSLEAEAKTLQAKYAGIKEESKRQMDVMVPSSVDPVRLVSEVSNIANQTGLSLNDVSYSENTNIGVGKGAYIVSFSVKTTYQSFKELMRNFETSLRLFNVLATNFAVSQTDSALINYQVKLETYYMK